MITDSNVLIFSLYIIPVVLQIILPLLMLCCWLLFKFFNILMHGRVVDIISSTALPSPKTLQDNGVLRHT